ncbi:MAG: hypothetical protein AAFU71_10945 [Cyanobacteria bacterium J06632_22]
MLIPLVTLNLSAALVCLGLAYGCWRVRRRLLRLQSRLKVWEQRVAVGLPVATLQLTQGRYGMVQAQQQYELWQRRRLQLVQILQVLQRLQWLWRRF